MKFHKSRKIVARVSSIAGGVVVGGITKAVMNVLDAPDMAGTTAAVATGALYASGSYNYIMRKDSDKAQDKTDTQDKDDSQVTAE